MATNILMPALSPTMTEGNLARWLKQEGERIKAGDVIAEIETDKATMEVEAVDEGILGRILVPAGTQGVKVNDVIAVLVEAGEAVPAAGAAPKATPAAAPAPAAPAPVAAAPVAIAPAPAAASGDRVFASPLARRMAAQAGDSAYGRLGIMVQYYCAVENLFEVPPTSFDPAPKVDSAIVRLVPYQDLPHKATNIKTLEKLVNVAFQQRRKTLRNALKQLLAPEIIEQLPIDTSARAEEISLAEYVATSNLLDSLSINTDAIPNS